jgi:Na+-driven multidrug efflux pump
MLGVVINSAYRPFLGILLQGGRPELHSLLVFSIVFVNFSGNLILIPYIGVYGAALTTSFVFILEAILIVYFGKKIFNINVFY